MIPKIDRIVEESSSEESSGDESDSSRGGLDENDLAKMQELNDQVFL